MLVWSVWAGEADLACCLCCGHVLRFDRMSEELRARLARKRRRLSSRTQWNTHNKANALSLHVTPLELAASASRSGWLSAWLLEMDTPLVHCGPVSIRSDSWTRAAAAGTWHCPDAREQSEGPTEGRQARQAPQTTETTETP